MIRFENVIKTYPTRLGERVILDNVSFTLERGEKLGVMGRNGAGKSTLVRLVSGAESPNSGRIDHSMSVSWPLAFGGAFQDGLTGQDNLKFISRIYNQDFRQNLDFVEQFAELGTYLREPVSSYSSGMRARLAFAISMIIEFDCYLIDEISAVGDVRFHEKCQVELFERRSDRAMLIVSHDINYVHAHCQRFAVLHQGHLKFFDDFDAAYQAHLDAMHVEGYQFSAL
ncbi:ABC transporter ATP-binding protein [Sphingomonas paeninsulae]|uniref:ABC transporter ATP-binding protein n=1 Tax=Sphingomonas paeninsulae TaxID=2319844 RepID=A0A494TIH1_SPHPE|nr:ABC transporter ATP-binding protein [Sphingomonas paeninsulae]AYJ87122.1 ABC transporter ATP-binding protein [Sphingomonas paeninsulae]